MTEQLRKDFAPQQTESENQARDNLAEQLEQETSVDELDKETDCPRCNGVMEVDFSFDALVYFCENCSFILKCVL